MRANKRGFSLIELMVVIAIVSVLMSLGIPAFINYLHNVRLRVAAESFLSGIQSARAEAIRLNSNVQFLLTNETPAPDDGSDANPDQPTALSDEIRPVPMQQAHDCTARIVIVAVVLSHGRRAPVVVDDCVGIVVGTASESSRSATRPDARVPGAFSAVCQRGSPPSPPMPPASSVTNPRSESQSMRRDASSAPTPMDRLISSMVRGPERRTGGAR